MKTLIITTIADNYRKRIQIAKHVKISHLAYMYNYNYLQLAKSLIKSYFVK